MFKYFETTNKQERDVIAENIKALYFRWVEAENNAYCDLLMAKTAQEHHNAQILFAEAIGRLGAVQAVLHELGVKFEGLPVDGGAE